MGVYSFLNINCAMAGPGIAANLAAGAMAAEEGITVEPIEDKNIMQIGADGQGQHTLVASDAVRVTVRLLKTSPVNALLMAAYNVQSVSSALWGSNVMTLNDSARGDLLVLQQVAFNKKPTLTYAKEAGMNEWIFDAISGTAILGV